MKSRLSIAAMIAGTMAFAGLAVADGMPRGGSVKDAPAAGYSWTGYYFGLNAGYAAGRNADWRGVNTAGNLMLSIPFTNTQSANSIPFGQSSGGDGFVGGVQIGYNWQINSAVVAGLEADIQFAGIEGSASQTGTAGGVTNTATSSQDLNWFSTLRGRLGLLLGSDRLLAYATAGLAFGDTSNSASVSTSSGAFGGPFGDGSLVNCAGGVCMSGSNSDTRFGWTIGGGLEWAISRNLTFRAEYLHIDLGDETIRVTGVPATTGNAAATVRFDNQYDVVRAALNFRF